MGSLQVCGKGSQQTWKRLERDLKFAEKINGKVASSRGKRKDDHSDSGLESTCEKHLKHGDKEGIEVTNQLTVNIQIQHVSAEAEYPPCWLQ